VFSFFSDYDIVSVWNVNLWQNAAMNQKSPGGFFPITSITDKYVSEVGKNLSIHILAFERFITCLNPGARVRSVVRTTDVKHSYGSLFHGFSQKPHLQAINKGLINAAKLSGAILVDIQDWLKPYSETKVAPYISTEIFRDEAHPQAWVLRNWMRLYLWIGEIAFERKGKEAVDAMAQTPFFHYHLNYRGANHHC
jgi:hypothetical protein